MKNTIKVLVPWLFPLLFAAAMLLFFPFRFRFEFDPDEGVNLIKAMMTLNGFDLFSDVWSDQPPIFNAFLSLWFRVVGMNVNAGRIMVLGFSTMLLWGAMYYLNKYWGVAHSVFGMIAIITLPFYKSLSISIMIGLPAIALAMLSFVGLMRWHEVNRTRWLVLSAILLAISIMTKLWTGILAPVFLLGIFLKMSGKSWRKIDVLQSFRPPIIWGIWFVLALSVVIILLVGPTYAPQLVSVHLAASGTEKMQAVAERSPMISYLDDSIALYLLSLAGVIIVVRDRNWHTLYLVAWALAAFLLLAWNDPFWHHHQLLITIPTAMLGSVAMGYSFTDILSRIHTSKLMQVGALPAILIAVLTLNFAIQRIPPTIRGFSLEMPNFHESYLPAEETDFEIVAIMRNYADKTSSVFTDRPMYAFRSGLPVHPFLAVLTEKRYSTGQPSQAAISEILEEMKPEQVILGRFDIPAVRSYMESRNFVRVDSSMKARHYVRGDIFSTP